LSYWDEEIARQMRWAMARGMIVRVRLHGGVSVVIEKKPVMGKRLLHKQRLLERQEREHAQVSDQEASPEV
jgi:hypothetical protein